MLLERYRCLKNFLIGVICEDSAVLPSKTAEKLRQGLRDEKEFKDFTDEDWIKFGAYCKAKGFHTSVFTGVLESLIKWLVNEGLPFPLTAEAAEDLGIFKGTRYQNNMVIAMGTLEKDDLAVREETTGAEILKKIKHGPKEEVQMRASPRSLYGFYMPSDGFQDLLDYLKKAKIKVK